MSHRITVAAAAMSDANGLAYPTYCIPEPANFEAHKKAQKAFDEQPTSEIGRSPIKVPKLRASIVLQRGAKPIEIEVGDELLEHLRADRNVMLQELGPKHPPPAPPAPDPEPTPAAASHQGKGNR